MGVYNQWNQQILQEAVNSILNQSLKDLEFIIYDDGSHPAVAEYMQGLAKLDERIVLIGAQENHGLAFSLNACIDRAKGEYIARMDSDDISLPNRLEKQVRFLEHHPEYMWCGCNALVFDEKGVWGERNMPEVPVAEDYLRFSPYIHPSVMYRAQVFEENDGYKVSKETLRCEDYEIFMRLHKAGYRGYNMQESLFKYRENQESYGKRKFRYRVNEAKVRYRNFKEMGILFPKGWIQVLRPVAGGFIPTRLLAWLKRAEINKKQDAKKKHESKNGLLQPHIAEENNL